PVGGALRRRRAVRRVRPRSRRRGAGPRRLRRRQPGQAGEGLVSTREFRFGVAVGMVTSGEELAGFARRVEQLGYASLAVADGLWLPAPFGVLDAAAAATTTLRLGTQVLATPLHLPTAVARQTDTTDLLS